jgi:hypothetical protein
LCTWRVSIMALFLMLHDDRKLPFSGSLALC